MTKPVIIVRHRSRVCAAAAGLLGCALSAYPGLQVQASFNPFGNTPALDDDALAQQRGGFISPEGVRVAIGYTMETQVNGALILRSQISVAPRSAPTAASMNTYQGTVTVANIPQTVSDNASVETSFDASGSTQAAYFVPQTTSAPGRQVFNIQRPGASIQVGTQVADALPAQTTAAPNQPNGSITQPIDSTQIAFDTAQFQSTLDASGYQGHYQAPDIDVVHQIQGGVPAAVISNTASNRRVDHRTIINLDLSQVNLPPSATLRAVNAGIANGLRTFR